MALPKRRTSKARKGLRQAHNRMKVRSLSNCSHCNQPNLPHRICPNCGYYRGREVIKPKE